MKISQNNFLYRSEINRLMEILYKDCIHIYNLELFTREHTMEILKIVKKYKLPLYGVNAEKIIDDHMLQPYLQHSFSFPAEDIDIAIQEVMYLDDEFMFELEDRKMLLDFIMCLR